MLIHACLHLDKHFVTLHVQFTSFNDIVNLLREVESQKSKVESQKTTDVGKSKVESQKTEDKRQQNQEPRIKTEEIEDFWGRLEAKCIKYKFADTVFRYLVMVRHYYGAPTSGTATHLLHLKALKNPIDFMRYMKGVVFPGKEFMVEKYSPLNPPQGGLEKKRGSSFPLEFVRPLTEVRGKYWWLWYGYRWAMGLKGLWLVITGTSTSSVTKK